MTRYRSMPTAPTSLPSRLNNNGFGQVIANIGNDRLKWETTRTWRFGFDASLFANRCSHVV